MKVPPPAASIASGGAPVPCPWRGDSSEATHTRVKPEQEHMRTGNRLVTLGVQIRSQSFGFACFCLSGLRRRGVCGRNSSTTLHDSTSGWQLRRRRPPCRTPRASCTLWPKRSSRNLRYCRRIMQAVEIVCTGESIILLLGIMGFFFLHIINRRSACL